MQEKKMVNGYPFIRYTKEQFDEQELKDKSEQFYYWMDGRRTCRDFSNRAIPKEVIENIKSK